MINNFEDILRYLGYTESENILYKRQISSSKLSIHNKRVLEILNPMAVYIANNEPLVIFFDDLINKKTDDNIDNKLWNSQIPFILSDNGDHIAIYSSRSISINQSGVVLNEIDRIRKDGQQNEDYLTNELTYWNITNEVFLEKYDTQLTKKPMNDYLLDNLRYLIKVLRDEFHLDYANKIVLRLLFIRYLIDRGIDIGYEGLTSNTVTSRDNFIKIIGNREILYDLFEYLKNKFNGSLFDISQEEEIHQIEKMVLSKIQEFFSASVRMRDGQYSLFQFYDFNIIPIELISNVYEVVLGSEKQKKDKAFYTPEYLVDFMLADTVKKHLYSNKTSKIIDPSCGSGIFLVKSLRLILEKNAESDGYISDNILLNDLVTENIYGIDCNDEAIDVTIFSIYVTLFDFKNPKKLDGFKFPNVKGSNLITSDFFDEAIDKLFEKNKFDFVLGNPPWGKVAAQTKYLNYFKTETGFDVPDKEICVSFMIRLKNILKTGVCSLIIPSKILYKDRKSSKKIREIFLEETTIDKVVELSSVRKQIFKDAVAPATIFTFTNKTTDIDPINNKILYISIKPNKLLNYYNLILIEPDDVKYIRQKDLLVNDWAWKTMVYGSYWDFEIVGDLLSKYKTIELLAKEEKLQIKNGIQTTGGDPNPSSHLIGKKLLISKNAIDHFYLDGSNFTLFESEFIHRPRDPELFVPPYVLFKKGLTSDFTRRAAYSEESYVYRDSINCIKGTEDQKDILKNITGLLNSSLYAYLNFLTGSSTGVEREQAFLNELKQLPYLFDVELVKLVDQLTLDFKDGLNYNDKQKDLKDFNDKVLMMFGLYKNPFVEYILEYQIPRASGKLTSNSKSSDQENSRYNDMFQSTWVEILGSDVPINTYMADHINDKYNIFVIDFNIDTRNKFINIDKQLVDIISNSKINDVFYQTKNIIEYKDNSIYIIKKNYSKNWHLSQAIRDCNEVIEAILVENQTYES
ncbi:N-6 DNA methylase [Erysipelothrix sp. HDW6C]|uniref:HsdM family class I SAM-dependent methyltransferase n=1 Tax=Erysipelothrix sp. HDW6C TaxID=2714930 RepID=UPI0014080FF2|nr:N-6 DNA methylase [Erysipelothrix sp. HDW6C]QIK70581.1 N-6 DNA methylase [Erysipelothrix sp. HDW6C]